MLERLGSAPPHHPRTGERKSHNSQPLRALCVVSRADYTALAENWRPLHLVSYKASCGLVVASSSSTSGVCPIRKYPVASGLFQPLNQYTQEEKRPQVIFWTIYILEIKVTNGSLQCGPTIRAVCLCSRAMDGSIDSSPLSFQHCKRGGPTRFPDDTISI